MPSVMSSGVELSNQGAIKAKTRTAISITGIMDLDSRRVEKAPEGLSMNINDLVGNV